VFEWERRVLRYSSAKGVIKIRKSKKDRQHKQWYEVDNCHVGLRIACKNNLIQVISAFPETTHLHDTRREN
jgi:hypothetical protein